MNKVWILSVAAVVLIAGLGFAGDKDESEKAGKKSNTVSGTLTSYVKCVVIVLYRV